MNVGRIKKVLSNRIMLFWEQLLELGLAAGFVSFFPNLFLLKIFFFTPQGTVLTM